MQTSSISFKFRLDTQKIFKKLAFVGPMSYQCVVKKPRNPSKILARLAKLPAQSRSCGNYHPYKQ